MFETATREEMERLERTVQRMFARVSYLEARLNELELERAAEQRQQPAAKTIERPHLVEALGLTA